MNLTGTNTYSGPTVIEGGTLSVSSIENGGVASGIGQASNAAGNLILNGGALEYVGQVKILTVFYTWSEWWFIDLFWIRPDLFFIDRRYYY